MVNTIKDKRVEESWRRLGPQTLQKITSNTKETAPTERNVPISVSIVSLHVVVPLSVRPHDEMHAHIAMIVVYVGNFAPRGSCDVSTRKDIQRRRYARILATCCSLHEGMAVVYSCKMLVSYGFTVSEALHLCVIGNDVNIYFNCKIADITSS